MPVVKQWLNADWRSRSLMVTLRLRFRVFCQVWAKDLMASRPVISATNAIVLIGSGPFARAMPISSETEYAKPRVLSVCTSPSRSDRRVAPSKPALCWSRISVGLGLRFLANCIHCQVSKKKGPESPLFTRIKRVQINLLRAVLPQHPATSR